MRTAVAIALAALFVAAPAADAKHAKPCSRKGSTTVRATKSVRVYQVKNTDGGHNLIGCLRSNNKRQLLAHGYDDVEGDKTGKKKLAPYVKFMPFKYDPEKGCRPEDFLSPTNEYVSPTMKSTPASTAQPICSSKIVRACLWEASSAP